MVPPIACQIFCFFKVTSLFWHPALASFWSVWGLNWKQNFIEDVFYVCGRTCLYLCVCVCALVNAASRRLFPQWLTGEQWSLTAPCWDLLTTQHTLLDTHWHTHQHTLIYRGSRRENQRDDITHSERTEGKLACLRVRKPVSSSVLNINKDGSLRIRTGAGYFRWTSPVVSWI